MIRRDLYLNSILPFIDKPVIKVITGIRRSGKSEILKMMHNELLERGIQESHIIYMNFESFKWEKQKSAASLYVYMEQNINNQERYYILLDEIQEVDEWEKAVNSFLVDWNVDITITGSNSRLLSSELSTYLTGRYVDFRILPLSFSEYLDFRGINTPTAAVRKEEFNKYLRTGGFPMVHTAEYSEAEIYKVVFDIYSSAILRDTIQRNKIRNIEMLERIVSFVFDNVGNCISAKGISDYFKSQNRRIDNETIYNYLQALESSFIIYKAPRYDLRGKELLQTNEKYYVADASLIYAVYGYTPHLIAGILENLVYLELLRKGYQVFVGKQDTKEIDFVAQRKDERLYIQVSYMLSADKTLEREIAPLKTISDNYPKYIVCMDELMTSPDFTNATIGIYLHLLSERQISCVTQSGNNVRVVIHVTVDSRAPQSNLITGKELCQMIYPLLAGYNACYLQPGRRTFRQETSPGKFHTLASGKHRVYQH